MKNNINHSETYIVTRTITQNRKHAKGDYIVVMNKELSNKFGKYVVVKHLYENKKSTPPEYKVMTAFGKVVIDNNLSERKIAIDQSIRSAIGISENEIDKVEVKLFPLKLTMRQKMENLIFQGNYFFARVHKPDVVDIEKNYCRMAGDAIRIMGALEGKSIILENATSTFKLKTNQIVDDFNSGNTLNALAILFTARQNVEVRMLTEEMKLSLNKLIPNSEFDNEYQAVEAILKKEIAPEDRKKYIGFLNNIFEIWDWEIKTPYKKTTLKVPIYSLQEESIRRVNEIMESQTEISFNVRYPDAEKIFEVDPDISGIYLDKYYRDLLHCNLLDGVKVKRNRIAIILNEIMEYGLMFVMSVVATVIAFNGGQIKQSLIALLISVIITVILIRIRTK